MMNHWIVAGVAVIFGWVDFGNCFAQPTSQDRSVAGNQRVQSVIESFSGLGVQADGSQPTLPQEALKTFELHDGFAIDLIAHEPDVSQPLFLSWDSAGRMWVVQYRQYQYPAGLKVVRFDQYLRAVFDKVPEPPPHGTLGADVISVLEDTDGDGLYDTSRNVIAGLNIATAVQVGAGGIWVLNPPYLLFYPDRNGDADPDGDPEVHLSGFGLQDTHAVSNSLTWGPDGWLYGANGSTTAGVVSSKVTKGVQFEGQCIWRYNPRTSEFEIYAEGGGNTFSLEIDSAGHVFSGTNGGNTRGYFYPQGSYSEKNWGKHGALTNPFAFGFFPAMRMEGDSRRFAQAFLIYEGGLFPNQYEGSIFAPNSLHNLVWNSKRLREGSTYRTIDQENLLTSSDRWFRPVYSGVGPDGAIYIADWYDTRLSHVNPVDDWHKESGRIYRIRPQDEAPRYRHGDLSQLSSTELISKFDDRNKWVRQRASLELGWRADKSCLNELIQRVQNQGTLEALWAIDSLDELTVELAVQWLFHPNADIRRWVVRLMGDRHEGHAELVRLASEESDLQVRSQLASTAKRVHSTVGLDVVSALMRRSEDVDDPHIPLLIWWAMESHCHDWPKVETILQDRSMWQEPIFRDHLVGRLMQRYALSSIGGDMSACERMIELAPDESSQEVLVAAVYRAFEGLPIGKLPPKLDEAMTKFRMSRGKDGLVLAIRSGRHESINEAIAVLHNPNTDLGMRIELLRVFGERRPDEAIEPMLILAKQANEEPSVRRSAIVALGSYDDQRIAHELIQSFHGTISKEHGLRETACRTLASRKPWAILLLNEIIDWRLAPTEIPADIVAQLRSFNDPEVIAKVEQCFGKAVSISQPEKLAEMKRLSARLKEVPGDAAKGKGLYAERCGGCHQLFGEGGRVGPTLDSYDRGNVDFWLTAILEPSIEIREGFQAHMALTDDGRIVTGLIVNQSPQTVTIRTSENRDVILVQDELEELKPMAVSLMPEGLFQSMSDEQVADLLAYLSEGVRR